MTKTIITSIFGGLIENIKEVEVVDSNEFINKFKDIEITNAENLSADKKKLYDLIMEVKESNNAILKEEQSQQKTFK